MKKFAYGLLAAGVLGLTAVSSVSAAVIVTDDFEGNEDRYTSDPNTGSGSSTGFFKDASTTATFSTEAAHTGTGSQKIILNDDPATDISTVDEWRLRNLSGGGTPANNVSLASDGFVGYWVKTSTPGFRISILIDDATHTERGVFRPVIADNQWHAYEWDFNNAADWDGFAGTGVDGIINAATVTVDATYFTRAFGTAGTDYDATWFIDDVSYNPTGSIVPEPTSLAALGLFGLGLVARRRRA